MHCVRKIRFSIININNFCKKIFWPVRKNIKPHYLYFHSKIRFELIIQLYFFYIKILFQIKNISNPNLTVNAPFN